MAVVESAPTAVHIGEDEVVDGDVVAIGGSVTVDGEVRGDVVAVGREYDVARERDMGVSAELHGGRGGRVATARGGRYPPGS